MRWRNKLGTAAIATAVMVASFSLSGCTKAANPWEKVEGGKLQVLVSFPPLYCFAKGVAGKHAKVETVLDTDGPHEHEAGPADALLMKDADLFVVNGLTLDDKLTKLADTSQNRKLKVVKVGDKLKKDLLLTGHDDEHGHEEGAKHDPQKHEHDAPKKEDKEDHKHGEWDPHVWLGTEQAIEMVKSIRDALVEADPANKDDYDSRAKEYVKKLEELQKYGKELFKDKKNRKLIAMHDSLSYFCKSFGLDFVDSLMTQEAVPSDPSHMKELVELCQKKDIKILALEPQYPAAKAKPLIEALAERKHKLAVIEIDPLETCPRDKLTADYYFEVMKTNLQALAKNME